MICDGFSISAKVQLMFLCKMLRNYYFYIEDNKPYEHAFEHASLDCP